LYSSRRGLTFLEGIQEAQALGEVDDLLGT
jgi:hypothetical protein